MVKPYYYSYEACLADAKTLISQFDGQYDAILAVARGGLSLAHLLAKGLNIRTVYSVNIRSYEKEVQQSHVDIDTEFFLNSNERILIVEDIVDTGNSMIALQSELSRRYPDLRYDIAALFYKPSARIKPTYYVHEATQWIDFYWEVDI